MSESIRYQMPVFSVDLETQIQPYRTTTETVRFLYSQPIPYDLIQRLIEALVPIRRIENPGNHRSES